MDELRELFTLRGKVFSAIEYLKREEFIHRNTILAILGDTDAGTDREQNGD